MKIRLVILLLSFTVSAFSNVDSDLHNFFNGLGYQSNVTKPQSYEGQAAGYYTGGSLFLRNQVKSYQLLSVQLPSFSGGCAGIDGFLGSFSVINTAQITQMMKNILSAGGAYAFDLALTTTVPQIKTVKDYIQKYVNDINNANINSCNSAEDLVGGVWPKTQSSQQQICRDIGTQNSTFSDWAAARQGCGTGGQFSQGLANGGDRKHEVVVNKNLVWSALNNNGFTANDTELSEMLMSLSGSIIIKSNAGKTQKTTLMSMANSQKIIKSILYGGTANIYICNDKAKCLNPSIGTITISDSNALTSQVLDLINNLQVQVATDSGKLSKSMKGFLEKTPIPILKYITTSLSLGRTINPSEFKDIIAISLLNQYLDENIETVKEALSQDDTIMSPTMASQINRAQQIISNKLSNSYKKLSNINVLIENMRANEKQLTGRLADQAYVGQETQ